jgi:pyrroline-5-carboxylate reductase
MRPGAEPIGVIGGGNIAQAILRGAIDAGVIDPRSVAVADPDSAKRDVFRALGVRGHKQGAEVMAWLSQAEERPGAGSVLLAVKPQSLEQVAREIGPLLGPTRRVVLSLLAGTPTAKVRALLGESAAVVRIMPNIGVGVKRSTTAVARGAGAEPGDEARAVEIFTALGRVVTIEEFMMDAFTAVAGSGPAYLFYVAEAMTKAAMTVGFDRDTAGWIVRWTLTGAAALLDATDQPPETLRAAVTSKGGTTAAATAVLDEAQVMETFVRAILAARDRGRQLARG